MKQIDPKTGSFLPEEENLLDKGQWMQFTLYARGKLWPFNCHPARGKFWSYNTVTVYARGKFWPYNTVTLYARGKLWPYNTVTHSKRF